MVKNKKIIITIISKNNLFVVFSLDFNLKIPFFILIMDAIEVCKEKMRFFKNIPTNWPVFIILYLFLSQFDSLSRDIIQL